MDSAHDLGGKQGHGKVLVSGEEPAFHRDWEARMWGINCALADLKSGSLDWWRHCRELISAQDYLNRPYFDSWMQTYSAFLIDQGVLSIDEVLSGKSEVQPKLEKPAPAPEAARAIAAQIGKYDQARPERPNYDIGQTVRCHLDGPTGHTRLPSYVRGRRGKIHQVRGWHLFPDSSARGNPEYFPLYTVRFESNELWPEVTEPGDCVFVDLWEPYLVAI